MGCHVLPFELVVVLAVQPLWFNWRKSPRPQIRFDFFSLPRYRSPCFFSHLSRRFPVFARLLLVLVLFFPLFLWLSVLLVAAPLSLFYIHAHIFPHCFFYRLV